MIGQIFPDLQTFIERGGWVLNWLLILSFVLWALILERLIYFTFSHGGAVKAAKQYWAGVQDKRSWAGHALRDELIGKVRLSAEKNINFIKALVALAPLLGLLGTVTGMIEVFDVMGATGASNARLMSAGVSKATIPTMAGMVVAISGILFSTQLERRAQREAQKVADELDYE